MTTAALPLPLPLPLPWPLPLPPSLSERELDKTPSTLLRLRLVGVPEVPSWSLLCCLLLPLPPSRSLLRSLLL